MGRSLWRLAVRTVYSLQDTKDNTTNFCLGFHADDPLGNMMVSSAGDIGLTTEVQTKGAALVVGAGDAIGSAIVRSFTALQLDCFSRYVDTLFDAMWSKPVNLGDLEVLKQVLTDADLDTESILTQTLNDNVKEELKQRTSEAIERGLFGCPTMFVDGEMFFGQDRIFFIEKILGDKSS